MVSAKCKQNATQLSQANVFLMLSRRYQPRILKLVNKIYLTFEKKIVTLLLFVEVLSFIHFVLQNIRNKNHLNVLLCKKFRFLFHGDAVTFDLHFYEIKIFKNKDFAKILKNRRKFFYFTKQRKIYSIIL